jgi:hypothetical protein
MLQKRIQQQQQQESKPKTQDLQIKKIWFQQICVHVFMNVNLLFWIAKIQA